TALDERARELKLSLPDAEVARRITEDPAFRGLTGQFDRGRFQEMIRAAGFTEPRFVAEQRKISVRRQLAEALGGELPAPRAMAEALNRHTRQHRSVEYVVLDRSKAGEIAPPTPEALAEYFESRKALFRAPEYRKVTVIALSIADALPWIAVSDADARAKYDSQRSRYVTPERRQLQQIVFPKPEEAKAAAERLQGGESV